MEKFLLTVSLGALALFMAPCQAADVAAGKALAQESCADCHGANGASAGPSPNSLAGGPESRASPKPPYP